jgi:DNA (cytosine-5)-methyltransferase 1
VLGAADVGANHQRDRIWIVGKIANTESGRSRFASNKQKLESEGSNKLQSVKSRNSSEMAYATSVRQQGQRKHEQSINSAQGSDWETNHVKSIGTSDFWKIEPNVGRVVDGVAARVDRLKAIGNGQVPLCAATAWRILSA